MMAIRFFSFASSGNRERDRGIDQVADHVDVLHVEPFTRQRGSGVGLVLVIGDDDLDRLSENLAAEILDGHLDRRHRAFAGFVRELSGHVRQHADLHDVVRDTRGLGAGAAIDDQDRRRRDQDAFDFQLHEHSSPGGSYAADLQFLY